MLSCIACDDSSSYPSILTPSSSRSSADGDTIASTPQVQSSADADARASTPQEQSLADGVTIASTPQVWTSPEEGVEIQRYQGVKRMQSTVEKRLARLQEGVLDDKYLGFKPVSEADLSTIEHLRRNTRISYYRDDKLLIVRLMPSLAHQIALHHLGSAFRDKVVVNVQGVSLFECGSAKFAGKNSSKEADAAYKPVPPREDKTCWPSLVMEVGFSQSLRSLQRDAVWWLKESNGDVKIVIIVAIERTSSKLKIQKWMISPVTRTGPATRGSTNVQPGNVQSVTVDRDVDGVPSVVGAPLVFDFESIFLRRAVFPERDIVLDGPDLHRWANTVWLSR